MTPPNTDFYIHFAPVTVKAFSKGQGRWTDYEEIKKRDITHMTVRPELHIFNIDTTFYTDLTLSFKEEDLPSDTFGLIYGDQEFEENIAAFMHSIFPEDQFGSPGYTEAGMQSDGLVSMEYNSTFYATLKRSSAHFKIALKNKPGIAYVNLSDFS